jgi:hypothetical protein
MAISTVLYLQIYFIRPYCILYKLYVYIYILYHAYAHLYCTGIIHTCMYHTACFIMFPYRTPNASGCQRRQLISRIRRYSRIENYSYFVRDIPVYGNKISNQYNSHLTNSTILYYFLAGCRALLKINVQHAHHNAPLLEKHGHPPTSSRLRGAC